MTLAAKFIQALVYLAFALATSGPSLADSPQVAAEQGVLAGKKDGGLNIFKGIPYAKPPFGVRRWTPPEPAGMWDGVREAVEFGPSCVQPPMPETSLYADKPTRMSEDCLTLNVWAPEEAAGAPVVVWIHGGALQRGGSAAPMYDGSAFARRGIVFVSINYRLGIFGWFAHSLLSAESPAGVSGNYGLLDQIAALRWVRANINAFGGDAENVTVMGESAGALSITYLLTSPLAQGLFHKAIIQSANIRAVPALEDSVYGLPSAHRLGALVASKLGADDLASLRAMDAHSLALAAAKARFWAQGAIDGLVLPKQVVDALEAGEFAKVPLFAGFNAGEVRSQASFLPPVPESAAAYEAEISSRYHDLAPAFLRIYPSSDRRESMLATLRDAIYGWATEHLISRYTTAGLPAYMYLFDHCDDAAAARGLCAFHAGELPYVFGRVGSGARLPANWPVPTGAAAQAISEAMLDYWVSFVRSGMPSRDGGPVWAPYGQGEQYMHFGEGAVVRKDPIPGMFELQGELVRRRRAAGQQWFLNVGVAATGIARAD